jgi:hypothetical protein
MVDAELHDGGSTSFTLVFLPEMGSARPNMFAAGYEIERAGNVIS